MSAFCSDAFEIWSKYTWQRFFVAVEFENEWSKWIQVLEFSSGHGHTQCHPSEYSETEGEQDEILTCTDARRSC